MHRDSWTVHHQRNGHILLHVAMMGFLMPSVVAGDDYHRIFWKSTAYLLNAAVGIADCCKIGGRHPTMQMADFVGVLQIYKRESPFMRLKPGGCKSGQLTVNFAAVILNI